jgi:hypothetical protein
VHEAVVHAIQARRAEIERLIAKGCERALVEARAEPDRPLRMLDLRRYPYSAFMEYVYFGDGYEVEATDIRAALQGTDVRVLANTVEFTTLARHAFRTYHDAYYRRLGHDVAIGEDWTPIITVTAATDPWGNVKDRRESEPHTYVRPEFAAAYVSAQPTEAGFLLSFLLDGSKSDGPAEASLGRFLVSESKGLMELRAAMDGFLADYGTTYPATVRQFERNLLAIVTSRRMQPVDRLDIYADERAARR